ncbi:MAG: hypothetical protein J3K34DRAFT_409518 [Monoraphidium minutum]|nr:MAG: hypothetical protein J3K34DRAFT_409518 [Monoraphidium minutum]
MQPLRRGVPPPPHDRALTRDASGIHSSPSLPCEAAWPHPRATVAALRTCPHARLTRLIDQRTHTGSSNGRKLAATCSPLFDCRCSKLPRPIGLSLHGLPIHRISPTKCTPPGVPYLHRPICFYTPKPPKPFQAARLCWRCTPGRPNTHCCRVGFVARLAIQPDAGTARRCPPPSMPRSSVPLAQAISTGSICSLLPPTRQLWRACPRSQPQPLVLDLPEKVHSDTTT